MINNTMRRTFWVAIFAVSFYAIQTYTKKEKQFVKKQNISKIGSQKCDGKIFETVTILGSLKFDRVTVSKKLYVTGPALINNSMINKLVLTGSLDATNSTFGLATITGQVSVEKCTSKENFLVTGSLEAFESNFNIVNVTGPVLFKNSTITSKLKITITGPLEAINSKFQDIDITTNGKITFDKCTANTIILCENTTDWWFLGFLVSSKKNKPSVVEIHLKGNSCIGAIEFEPGVTGTVILEDKTASVGTIKNGVLKKNFDVEVLKK